MNREPTTQTLTVLVVGDERSPMRRFQIPREKAKRFMALGAAVAGNGRKVLALQADGCAMYTPQALWSIARENLDVTIVILKNDRYGILEVELARVRESAANDKMMSMLELDKPSIDWVQIAGGMGIPATSATTAEEFYQQLAEALAHKGPRLVEAVVAQDLSPMVQMVARV